MPNKTKVVPKNALRLAIGDFQFGDNGPDAKTIPVRLQARSAEPIEHWFWGRVVHDMAGMILSKPRLPLDYAHRDDEVVGYLNQFSATNDGLSVSGAVVPFTSDDRASEIVHKQKNGVPYEASINFGGDGIRIEDVPEGFTAQVNGRAFDGPGIIIRSWPLRGVAICPYGADQNTSAEFQDGGEVAVEVFSTKGEAMSKRTNRRPAASKFSETAVIDPPAVADPPVASVDPPVAGDPPAETPEDDDEVVAGDPPADPPVASADPPAAPPAAPQLSKPADVRRAELGTTFRKAFGDERGSRYFADGLSYEQATTAFVAALRDENDSLRSENDELRQRLSAVDRGADPVDFASKSADEDNAVVDKPTSLRSLWKRPAKV